MGPEVDGSSPAGTSADETRQAILKAASQVFAEKGYARATTRALAEAAEVNEVTLFRHFGSKEGLFAAVLAEFGGLAISADMQAQLSGDYRQDLSRMGQMLRRVFAERGDAMRLMLCEAAHFPELRQMMVENPRQLRMMLAAYFQRQIEQGQVRPLHPEMLAQAFLGMFFSYSIGSGLLQDSIAPDLAEEELVEQFVDVFVAGTARP
ncbi:MAG: TetR/AcrR family transcriptional regulator [Anaerolineae bacterium]|jgi:AcrR family transcriptional regulator